MFKWQFNTPYWTDEEKNEIVMIIRQSLSIFRTDSYRRGDEFEEHFCGPMGENIDATIEKNIEDVPSSKYEGHSIDELRKKYGELVDFLKSDPEYEIYLDIIERIIRRSEALGEKENLPEKTIRDIIDSLDRMPGFHESEEVADNHQSASATVNGLPELRSRIADFKRFMRSMSFRATRLGEFDSEKNRIVIYMKAIRQNSGKTNENVLVEEVIVHELFHAMHYAFAVSNITKNWKTTSRSCDVKKNNPDMKKIVKESLADYFAYTYLRNKVEYLGTLYERNYRINEDVELYADSLKQLKEKWDSHDVMCFPYAGAKAFIYDPDDPDEWDRFRFADEHVGELFVRLSEQALSNWKVPYKAIMTSVENGYKAGYEIYLKYNEPEEYLIRKYYPDLDEKDYRHFEAMNRIRDFVHDFYVVSGKKLNMDKLPENYNVEDFEKIMEHLSRISWAGNHRDMIQSGYEEVAKQFTCLLYNGAEPDQFERIIRENNIMDGYRPVIFFDNKGNENGS